MSNKRPRISVVRVVTQLVASSTIGALENKAVKVEFKPTNKHETH